jgi:hypothetical protein
VVPKRQQVISFCVFFATGRHGRLTRAWQQERDTCA